MRAWFNQAENTCRPRSSRRARAGRRRSGRRCACRTADKQYVAQPGTSTITNCFDVVVRNKNPAEEETPAVLFPAKEAER